MATIYDNLPTLKSDAQIGKVANLIAEDMEELQRFKVERVVWNPIRISASQRVVGYKVVDNVKVGGKLEVIIETARPVKIGGITSAIWKYDFNGTDLFDKLEELSIEAGEAVLNEKLTYVNSLKAG